MAQVDPQSKPLSDREAEERFLDRLEEMGLYRPPATTRNKRRWQRRTPVIVEGEPVSRSLIADRR